MQTTNKLQKKTPARSKLLELLPYCTGLCISAVRGGGREPQSYAMVLLCWSLIGWGTEERYEKADLTDFHELVAQHACVWKIEEDLKHLLWSRPNPSTRDLMLLLLDYHTDCSDPAQLAIAKAHLEEVNDAFCDAMLSGENSSSDEGRDPDSPGRFENQLYPPMFKVLEEGTPLWQEFVEAPLERDPRPDRWAIGGQLLDAESASDLAEISRQYNIRECPQCKRRETDASEQSVRCADCGVLWVHRQYARTTLEAEAPETDHPQVALGTLPEPPGLTMPEGSGAQVVTAVGPVSTPGLFLEPTAALLKACGLSASSPSVQDAVQGLLPPGVLDNEVAASSNDVPIVAVPHHTLGGLDPIHPQVLRSMICEWGEFLLHPDNAYVFYNEQSGYFALRFTTISFGNKTATNVDGHITLLKLASQKRQQGYGDRIAVPMDNHFKSVVANMQSNKKKKKTSMEYMSGIIDTKPDECTKPNYAIMFLKPSGLYSFCHEIVGRGIAAFHFPWFERLGNPHASIRLRAGDSGPVIRDRIPMPID